MRQRELHPFGVRLRDDLVELADDNGTLADREMIFNHFCSHAAAADGRHLGRANSSFQKPLEPKWLHEHNCHHNEHTKYYRYIQCKHRCNHNKSLRELSWAPFNDLANPVCEIAFGRTALREEADFAKKLEPKES